MIRSITVPLEHTDSLMNDAGTDELVMSVVD
jgi:hypothetical protein